MEDRDMNMEASDKLMALTLEQIKCYLELLEGNENWQEKAITYLDKLIQTVE